VLAVDVSKAQSIRHSSPPHSGPKGPERDTSSTATADSAYLNHGQENVP
jgi:hypothetical protein